MNILLKKGDHYAFFLFFKVSIIALFIFGFFSVFFQDGLGSIKPIHTTVDEEVVAEKELASATTEYSQVFLIAGLNIDAFGGDDALGVGGADDTSPIDQGNAFLWSNISEMQVTTPTEGGNIIRRYVVQPGDTAGGIARQFDLSLNTLLWSNDLHSSDYIQPGDELVILPTDGIIYEIRYGDTISSIAVTYQAESNEILRANDIASAAHIVAGQSIIIPGGIKPPTPKYVATRSSSPALQTLSNYFIKPTAGYISQGYSSRHKAVDIAGGCWQAVYAAASGNISLAVGNGRWNGGFGSYVKISHPNGVDTLYAHMIQVSVGQGQYVTQGQLVGYTGSTGRSSGCHLHWEVHGAYNPLG